MKYLFEVPFPELEADLDGYVAAVFSCLESEFLVLPKGDGFIEDRLFKVGISYRKTKRAERIAGFDQTPDFIIPSEFNPQVVIEAKITEDDGTARDKVTRVQHLASLSQQGSKFEVIACIAGRGFDVRREDMKKLLLATRGKVFTLKTLDYLVEFTRLREFKSVKPLDY